MELTHPVAPSEIEVRHAQVRGMGVATILAHLEDFERELRTRYAVSRTDDKVSGALAHVMRTQFPFWLLWKDRVGFEVAGTAAYSRNPKYDLPWPGDIADALAPFSDVAGGKLPRGSRSIPVAYTF